MVGISNQPTYQISEEVKAAAMPRRFDLADVFELVVDRLNHSSLAQEHLIEQAHEAIRHVLTPLRNQL